MVGLTTDNIVTIIIVAIGYLAAGILAYVNLNVKIAEIVRDFMALRNEYNEHRESNKESFQELKQLQKDDRQKNDRDHEAMMTNLASISENLGDFKTVILSKMDSVPVKKKK